MAEIPVERKEKSAFPWWLIPLLLLLLLIPFLYFYNNRAVVVDNTNHNVNRTIIGANADNNSGVMTNANYTNAR